MEEILASIRRIIADDDSNKAPPKAADPLPPPPTPMAPRPEPVVPPRPAPPPPSTTQAEIESMLTNLNAAAPPLPAPRPPRHEEPPDVLDLTEAMAEQPPPAANAFRTIDGQSDVFFEDRSSEPDEPEVEPASQEVEARRPEHRQEYDGLVSSSTSAAVDSAFNTLAQTVLVQNARTLEDLVREMLRPLLKTWLDDNLPELVERLVRAEIERVSRGRS
jgi:cell pole-organizing protein PopZ